MHFGSAAAAKSWTSMMKLSPSTRTRAISCIP